MVKVTLYTNTQFAIIVIRNIRRKTIKSKLDLAIKVYIILAVIYCFSIILTDYSNDPIVWGRVFIIVFALILLALAGLIPERMTRNDLIAPLLRFVAVVGILVFVYILGAV